MFNFSIEGSASLTSRAGDVKLFQFDNVRLIPAESRSLFSISSTLLIYNVANESLKNFVSIDWLKFSSI